MTFVRIDGEIQLFDLTSMGDMNVHSDAQHIPTPVAGLPVAIVKVESDITGT